MTNNQHGQVPEALIDLIDAYAETRHRCGGIYNARTEAARKAVIEALSGVQALSAAPASPWSRALEIRIAQGWKLKGDRIPVLYTDTINGEGVGRDDLWLCTTKALAASPTPTAEQQAAPKAAQVDPDKLMRDCLALLESFDYEDDEDSQSKAFFNAHINADWFFHVKHSIERQLEAKWGTQPQAGAVPQGWKAVPVNPTPEMWKAAKSVPDPNPPYPPHYGLVWDAMLAASPTPTAEQQAAPKAAPGVGNSGFDHQTAADFLSGKTVSDEAVRKFVAESRWAHNERAALSATLLAMHGVLTSREAEIALLKKALLEAEAAPQPAPAPLSDDVVKDAALWHWLAEYLVGTRTDLDDEIVASKTVNDLRKLVEAAIKQGGKA